MLEQSGQIRRTLHLVAIVEDDPDDRLIAEEQLNRSGVVDRVESYGDPVRALEWFQTVVAGGEDGLPNLILLDVNMPSMNAFEFLDALSTIASGTTVEVPVVLLTSSEAATDQGRAASYPVVKEYLVKPITRADAAAMAARFGVEE